MNWQWKERGGWWTCRSPAFRPRAAVCGVFGAPKARVVQRERRGKNPVWSLRSVLAPNLRSQAALGARPLGRRHQNLPGDREPSGAVPEWRQGEAGEAGMALRQLLFHQAPCLLRGPALSSRYHPGHGPRVHLDWKTVKELDKEYMREQLRRAGTPAPRAIGIERSRSARGAHLPHRGQRPGAAPSDLVRRAGPFRSEPRCLLPMAGSREKQAG